MTHTALTPGVNWRAPARLCPGVHRGAGPGAAAGRAHPAATRTFTDTASGVEPARTELMAVLDQLRPVTPSWSGGWTGSAEWRTSCATSARWRRRSGRWMWLTWGSVRSGRSRPRSRDRGGDGGWVELSARFAAKVVRTPGCHFWVGANVICGRSTDACIPPCTLCGGRCPRLVARPHLLESSCAAMELRPLVEA